MEIAWCLICHLWYLPGLVQLPTYLLSSDQLIHHHQHFGLCNDCNSTYTYGWTTSPKPAAVAVTVGEGWWWWEREAADEVQVSQSSNFFWMSLADVHRVGSVIQSNWRFNRVQLLGRGENLRSLIRQRASQHISWPSANFFCVEL